MSVSTRPLQLLASTSDRTNLPLFVFLPGMDGTGKLLDSQQAGLKSLYDVRCLSIPPDDLTGWNGLVEQIAGLIRKEKQRFPSRPIVLCGESFGGCLALKLAVRHAPLFDRLILVNPASAASRQPWLGWGASFAQRLPGSLYRLSTFGLLPLLIASHRVPVVSQQALLAAMQSVSPPSAAWRLSLLSQFVIEKPALKRIEQPVLVLASGSDRLLPSVHEARRLERHLPNSQTVLLPESGHACLLEKEVKFGSILKSHNFSVDARKPDLALSR
jgi:pimeloyl-ACP methyl ester carboxylesterase